MTFRVLLPTVGLAVASLASAQTVSRQAVLRGGGNSNEGKCTVEVIVDGAAQVEIRGTSAQLTNLKGQPAQWKRFECTSAMPANPEGFRFSGVDGRGSQQLVREPRNGSPAAIEISDPDNGSEAYTFDITWGNRGPVSQGGYNQEGYNQRGSNQRGSNQGGFNQGGFNQGGFNQGNYDQGGYNQRGANNQPQRGNYPPQGGYAGGQSGPDYGRSGASFGVDQAISVCHDNIRQQASERFRTNDIQFRQMRSDDNPGRRDWVIGNVQIRSPREGDVFMRFSCSVDFATGRVRSATLEPAGDRGLNRPQNSRGIENCERAAQQRVLSQGFERVNLGDARFENDRGPRVVGDLRAYGRNGAQSFRYSCSVEQRDGDVRSVDLFPGQR